MNAIKTLGIFWGVIFLIIIMLLGPAAETGQNFDDWLKHQNKELKNFENSAEAMKQYIESKEFENSNSIYSKEDILKFLEYEQKSILSNTVVSKTISSQTFSVVDGNRALISKGSGKEDVILNHYNQSYPYRLPWQLVFAIAQFCEKEEIDNKIEYSKINNNNMNIDEKKLDEIISSISNKYKMIELPETCSLMKKSKIEIKKIYKKGELIKTIECWKEYFKNWSIPRIGIKTIQNPFYRIEFEYGPKSYSPKGSWKLLSYAGSKKTNVKMKIEGDSLWEVSQKYEIDLEVLVEICKLLPDGESTANNILAVISENKDVFENYTPEILDPKIIGLETSDYNIKYYNQNDSRWALKPYGAGTVQSSGCGPTCTAMVLSSLGRNITPDEACKWSQQKGFRIVDVGTDWGLFTAIAKANNIKVRQYSPSDWKSMIKALKKGPVIASMKPGDFTKTGHFIVIRGFNDDGELLISDPNSLRRSKPWNAKRVIRQCRAFWAYSN